MKTNCDNPSCKSIVDTNKIHIIRYDKATGYKMHFCTENCDIVHKYIFDKNERYNFHKIADIWKKQIEKDFRAFYDYMPESHFKFFIKEKEMDKKSTEDKIVAAIVDDLTDRRGLRQEWDNIDEDIQEEIKETWKEIIKKELKKGSQ